MAKNNDDKDMGIVKELNFNFKLHESGRFLMTCQETKDVGIGSSVSKAGTFVHKQFGLSEEKTEED